MPRGFFIGKYIGERRPMANRGKPSKRNHESRRPAGGGLLVFVLLAVAGWWIYGQSLDAPYIFDDLVSVEDNPSITRLWPLIGSANDRGPLNPPKETPTSARPLVNLSFAIDYHFTGRDPRGFRRTNLALHIVNATLLWLLVRRTLLLPYFAGRFARSAGTLAFVAAMLWLVHPLVTETVAYITQRSELVVAFFYLATLYASLRYFTAETLRSHRAWLTLAVFASAAGMASKEVMVSAPLVVLLFDRTFLAATFRQAVRQSWPLYVGLVATWAIVFALQIGGPRSLSAGFGLALPLVDYWSTQAKVLLMYLKLAMLPTPLLIHYELSLQSLSVNWPYVVAVVALVVGAAVLLWRRHPVGFVAACVFAILAPTHIVPIPSEMAAERRMYLPVAALATLAVIGCYLLVVKLAARSKRDDSTLSTWYRGQYSAFGLLALLAILVYGIASARRAAEYNLPSILWRQVVIDQPRSHVAHHGLAVRLFEEGRLEEAVPYYREALKLHPEYPEAQYGLGLALLHLGRPREAIEPLRVVVRLKPDAERIRNNLGVALFSAGQVEEAIEVFEEVLERNPKMWEAHDNLGRALLQAGRDDEARKHFDEAARLQREAAQE
jgi:protein O-mannosyl-transferase